MSGTVISDDEDRHNPFAAPFGWMVLTPISMAFGGIGCAMAFAILSLNELATAVRGYALDRGPHHTVTVSAHRVDPAREGALVHVTGPAVAAGVVTDPDIGVAAPGVRLFRTVEMYQWAERKITSRRKVTGYEYSTHWSQAWHDSTDLVGPKAPRNPVMPLLNEEWQADMVTVGAFRLNREQVARIGDRVPLSLARQPSTRTVAFGTLVRHGDTYYLGRDPAQPEIGDLRINYSVYTAGAVSILAAQAGNSFAPFQVEVPLPAAHSILESLSPSSSTVDVVRDGTLTVQELVQSAQRYHGALTWGVRLLGVLLMVVGVKLFIWPGAALLRVIGRVLPTQRHVRRRDRRLVATRLGVGLAVISAAFSGGLARGLAGERIAMYAAASAVVVLLVWVALPPENAA